jgi:chromate transport protein ChrA
VVYTLLAGSAAFRVLNLTLMPAALAIVVVSAFRLGQEFFAPSVELALAVGAGLVVLVLGLNPTLVLLGGGVIGALLIRSERADTAG